MILRTFGCFVALSGILGFTSIAAAEPLDLKAALGRRVIDPERPLAEVQSYTESRVPPMPNVKTVAEWETHAKRMREETLSKVVFRGAAAKWRRQKTRVEWLATIPGGKEYRIRKLRYEAVPGIWIPALLYEPTQLTGKVPVVMNVNGHDGKGKLAKYKQIRCINMAKRGMLALNVEWLGMGQLRTNNFSHYRMNQLDLCGTSGVSPFYLSMKRGIDVLLSHKHADPKRVAVAGLSGGGWQTIFISSLDTRVTLSDPVAGYSSFRTRARHTSDLGDSEQTPVDLATTADYAQLTALRAPRPTLLTFNANDNCCFKAEHALPPLVEAARPIYSLYGKTANLRTHVNHNPGSHNFEKDNRQQLYRMIGDHFYRGEKFDAAEIPCDDELKSAEQLQVDLPENNGDFHQLAVTLSRGLPRGSAAPTDLAVAKRWQSAMRANLKATLRAHNYGMQAVAESDKRYDDARVTSWWLRVGGNWTVPAVEIVRGKPTQTTILLADGGRASAVKQAKALLAAGHRVLAVDPFYFGESKISKRDFLYALLISAVGDRPLGIQASQVAAIARWSRKEFGVPVDVAAVGERTSLIALCAAGLETTAITGVQLHGSFASLHEVIEQNISVNQKPELFCFGLLEKFDVKQLAMLAAPRPVRFHSPAERHKKELGGLTDWYRLWGKRFSLGE